MGSFSDQRMPTQAVSYIVSQEARTPRSRLAVAGKGPKWPCTSPSASWGGRRRSTWWNKDTISASATGYGTYKPAQAMISLFPVSLDWDKSSSFNRQSHTCGVKPRQSSWYHTTPPFTATSLMTGMTRSTLAYQALSYDRRWESGSGHAIVFASGFQQTRA